MKNQPLLFGWKTYVFLGVILIGLSTFLKSCSKSSNPAKITSVQLVADPVLGSILTDNKNNTLYIFANDVEGSKCAGGCLLFWPPFYDSLLSPTSLGSGLQAADFGIITAANGAKQNTYKGWPLYYYAPKDAASGTNIRELPGERKGEKVGNTWFTVKPDYTIMLANKKVIASGTTDTTQKEFLIDSAGNTLYLFSIDSLKPGSLSTNCINGCIIAWPVFYTPNLNSLPSLLNKADFGEIVRTDGPGGASRKQSTYKGRPLYYFAADGFTKGSAKGEGVGKVWYVMKPDVTKIN